MGGLGNQMFQYAVALGLAERHRVPCKVDLSFLLERRPDLEYTARDFDLVVFGSPPAVAAEGEVRKFRRLLDRSSRSLLERIEDKWTSRAIYREPTAEFAPEVLQLPGNTYLEGFFQHEGYFAEIESIIRKSFHLDPAKIGLSRATLELGEKIDACQGVCLHVRRGDYVSNPIAAHHHGTCSETYYRGGLDELRARGASGDVFAFSDDPAWCQTVFADLAGLTVVGEEHAGLRAAGHLWLMTRCHHFVISNSSYGWWAAWLAGKAGKTIVRPAQWFRAPELRHIDICPGSWISLEN